MAIATPTIITASCSSAFCIASTHPCKVQKQSKLPRTATKLRHPLSYFQDGDRTAARWTGCSNRHVEIFPILITGYRAKFGRTVWGNPNYLAHPIRCRPSQQSVHNFWGAIKTNKLTHNTISNQHTKHYWVSTAYNLPLKIRNTQLGLDRVQLWVGRVGSECVAVVQMIGNCKCRRRHHHHHNQLFVPE